MSLVRFRSHGVSLELHGSEAFVLRQLRAFAPDLGPVDLAALEAEASASPAPEPPIPAAVNGNGGSHEAATGEPEDPFLAFCRTHPLKGRDQQSEAALLFAYWLHRHEGSSELRLGDLLRCCIRAGVDTRNFNHAIGGLVRKEFLLPLGGGNAYRLSEQGVAAVESRA